MRLEQLTLRTPGDEFRLCFHERLTILSGIGVLERRALVDSLVSSLLGGPETTSATYVEGTGRRVTAECDRGRLTCHEDDGTPVGGLVERSGRTAEELRSLMVLHAADLGLHTAASAGEPPELAEARANLAGATEELHAARSARQSVEAMRDDLAAIDELIRQSEENRSRRQYAHLLARLEQVRSEAASLRGGHGGARADRHLLASADTTRAAAAVWRAAVERRAELRAAFDEAGFEPLDVRSIDEAADAPEDVPADLDELMAALEAAEAERVDLSVRLREMAASRLAEPSHPAVGELARLDQEPLWEANRATLAAAAAVEARSLALGGLAEHALSEDIERQHDEVLAADSRMRRSKVTGILSGLAGVGAGAGAAFVEPMAAPAVVAAATGVSAWLVLAPRRALAAAERRQEAALARVGAGSYLGFHLRRVEASTDPDSRESFELAVLEHRLACARWADLAGSLDPRTAAALEEETRAYAASLRQLGGAAEEIEVLRRALVDRVEPAAAGARAALLTVCAPFGIDDPFLAPELVRHQVAAGRTARLQRHLHAAQEEEDDARRIVDGLLRSLGFADGDLGARVGALEWALSRAGEREVTRSTARAAEEVERELAALEEEARSSRRPEWASVTASDVRGPDLDELVTKRTSIAGALEATMHVVPDVARLADRHRALARRVGVLEAAGGSDLGEDEADAGAVRQYLLAQLTQARGGGPDGDSLPVVVDEALVRLHGDAKWELLDVLERMASRTQLVYLTDDPYVGAWARRRAATGAITLLEPVAERV